MSNSEEREHAIDNAHDVRDDAERPRWGERPEILRWFKYDHLPEKLRSVSAPFCELAYRIVETCPPCAETTVALRKLLESKDAAVRAALALAS